MATPFLRSLRELYPDAHIAALCSRLALPVITGLACVDEAIEYILRPDLRISIRATVGILAGKKFDLAVLLPNSFRSALIAWRASIPRRLGYRRECRGVLLTDGLDPEIRTDSEISLQLARKRVRNLIAANQIVSDARLLAHGAGWQIVEPGKPVRPVSMSTWCKNLAKQGNFQPVPTIDYYLALTERLGGKIDCKKMFLGMTEAERSEAQEALQSLHIDAADPYLLIFPGANFGSSKCWMPERFAEIASHVADPKGDFRAHVLIGAAPNEKSLVDAIFAALPSDFNASDKRYRIQRLSSAAEGRGVSLGAIKELVRRSRLVLCNDTGPRHFAAALNTPLVTLFGPTDPRWAETFYKGERILSIEVPCGPCQLKRCPIDHRCMRGLTTQMVLEAMRQQWSLGSAS